MPALLPETERAFIYKHAWEGIVSKRLGSIAAYSRRYDRPSPMMPILRLPFFAATGLLSMSRGGPTACIRGAR